MRFDEIMTMVQSSNAENWTEVQDLFEVEHSTFYILREDASISLAFGAPHRDGEAWSPEPWSQGFADKKVYGYWLDVRYNGVTIHRDLIMSVDGGRAYLPAGTLITEPNKGIVGMKTNQSDVARARLIDLLSGSYEFDSYLTRANITIKKPPLPESTFVQL